MAKQKPLRVELSVNRAQKERPIISSLRQQILERDDHTCQFCGFRSEKYQEIHCINQDYEDHNPNNLVTSCFFCHQCFHLEKVTQMGSGVLIWMPEISQEDLHHLARAIYVGRISQGVMAETSRGVLELIMQRRDEVKQRLGSDDPYVLAMVLNDYISASSYQTRSQKLDGVRLFPLDRRKIKEANLEFNQFPQILAYWRSKQGPFKDQQPVDWLPIFKGITEQFAA